MDSLGFAVLDVLDDSFNKDNYEWIIGDLDAGDDISLIIPMEINSSNKTVVVDGTVYTSTFETNEENNYDKDNLTINPLCDLIIDISVSNSTVNNGDAVDLVVVVSNDGPDDAKDVSVSLSDLDDLGLVILEVSDDSFNKDDNEWVIGDLDSGESVSLTVTVKANKSNENITVSCEVETSTFETNKENNLDNDSLKVLPLCDVAIAIYPNNATVKVGETVNWIINVTNKGPDKAGDVDVFNSFPEGLEFVFSQSSKGEIENSTNEDGEIIDFIWKVGDLKNNESAYLVISTDALEEGLIFNNASVNSSTYDSNESNNFDSSAIKVFMEDNSNETDENQKEDESDDGNDDNDKESSDDGADDGDDSSEDDDGDMDDEFPMLDYFLDDNDDQDNNLNKNDSKSDKSKKSIANRSKEPVNISNQKSGNPLVFVVLSIFALFLFPFRKI